MALTTRWALAIAFVALVLAPPAMAAHPHIVVTDVTMGIAHGSRSTVGTIAETEGTAANATIRDAYVDVSISVRLTPTSFASSNVNWFVVGPNGSISQCSGSFSRASGAGSEEVTISRLCSSFAVNGTGVPIVNGTYGLVTSQLSNAAVIAGHIRPVAVQEFKVSDEVIEIQTALDAWLPYLLFAVLFVAAVRSQALGVAFVALAAAGLTAAGAPWQPATVAVFLIAAGLLWWLPQFMQTRKDRKVNQ